MGTPRFARLLALSIAIPAALGARTATAAPTTLGVEWEMGDDQGPKQLIVFGDAFKSAGTSSTNVVTRAGNAEVDKRLLCTTLHSRIDPAYPLVTISYDLGAARTFMLEVITGPIASTDEDAWNDVAVSVGAFYTAVRAHCATEGERCRISVADAVAAAKGFTTKCEQTTELTDPQRADVTIEVPSSRDKLMQTIAHAGTQVSLAIDWARFGRMPGLAWLYDGMWDSDNPREWTGYAGSLSSQLFDYAHKRLLPAFGGLTDVQRGFLVHYLTGLYAFDAYMLRRYEQTKPSEPFAGWAATYVLDDAVDWKLKNNWYLLPKEPLSEIFKRIGLAPGALDDASKFCAPELAKGLTLVDGTPELDALATAFGVAGETGAKKQALSLDDDDDAPRHLASDGAGLVQSCLDLYPYWKSSITSGNDPMQLATIASVIPSAQVGGELRGVFELRRNHRIVDQHRLSVQVDAKRVVVGWTTSPLGLPNGLALPDDRIATTKPTTDPGSSESDDD